MQNFSFSPRKFLVEGLNTSLDQGCIFYGAYAEDYRGSSNYGLIITARCDIAQNKAKKYSYLPVVSLNDWMRQDLVQIVKRRVSKNVQNKLLETFSKIGGTELIIKTYSLEKIRDAFSSEGTEKNRAKFFEACDLKVLFEKVSEVPVSEEIFNSFLKSFKSEVLQVIKSLVGQNESGYYFIDEIWNEGPHVVLLREIHHIDNFTAHKLREGVEMQGSMAPNYLGEKLSYTVGVIDSPFIEHIMQKFSELFVRIGIEDPDFSAPDAILKGFIDD